MRLRLIISFALIIMVALGTVLLVTNLTAENQVKGYLRKGALAGVDTLVEDLEAYDQPTTNWEGVESVLATPTAGMVAGALMTDEPTDPMVTQVPGPGSGSGFGAGEGQGTGPGGGKQNNNGEGQGEQAHLTPIPPQIILPTSTPFPTTEMEAAVTTTPDEMTVTETTPTPTNTTESTSTSEDILPASLDLSVSGKTGHILTDENGVIVYSPVESDIGMIVANSALINAIAIVDESDNIVGYLIPAGGNPELPKNLETQLLSRIQQATMIAALISGVIAIILALILAQVILKPVKVLTRAAESMAQGNLDQRVTIKGKDEVAVLGKTFNQMATSIQAVESQRRSMTSDIAHELRTPLAVQQANLEALQDGVYPLTVATLTPVVEQNRLLTRLVDDLRTLALADSGELSLNRRTINLPELCSQVVLRFEAAMAHTGIQVRQVAEAGIPQVMADPERIEQILHNLLQNAQRYTPSNAIVDVKLFIEDNMAVVQVSDHGPGIPETELEKIFERFHRIEKSRDRIKGGTGLGLAIARKLAEAHGGSLSATNDPEGGAVFSLRLPLGM
jgi:signal transduction histidine kinase